MRGGRGRPQGEVAAAKTKKKYHKWTVQEANKLINAVDANCEPGRKRVQWDKVAEHFNTPAVTASCLQGRWKIMKHKGETDIMACPKPRAVFTLPGGRPSRPKITRCAPPPLPPARPIAHGKPHQAEEDAEDDARLQERMEAVERAASKLERRASTGVVLSVTWPKDYVPIFNSNEWKLHVQTGRLRARERQGAMAAKAAKACRRRLAAAWKKVRADIAVMRAWAEESDDDAMPLSS